MSTPHVLLCLILVLLSLLAGLGDWLGLIHRGVVEDGGRAAGWFAIIVGVAASVAFSTDGLPGGDRRPARVGPALPGSPTGGRRFQDRPIGESQVTPAGKVAFEGGGEFLRETQREVELYLADARTRRSGLLRLYTKAVVALAATGISWTVLLLGRMSSGWSLLALPVLRAA